MDGFNGDPGHKCASAAESIVKLKVKIAIVTGANTGENQKVRMF